MTHMTLCDLYDPFDQKIKAIRVERTASKYLAGT
jgi:hypothetical protein